MKIGTLFECLSALLLLTCIPVGAQAAEICQEVDGELYCLPDEDIAEKINEQAIPGLSGNEFLQSLAAIRQEHSGPLLVDSENRFRELSSRQLVPYPTAGSVTRSIGVGTGDDGNGDEGDLLYGPSNGGMVCFGFSTIDGCKACCVATRSSLLIGVGSFASKCHTAANGCIWAAWVCHAGCALTEAAMLAALIYNTRRCSFNCEQPYANSWGIDFPDPSTDPLAPPEDPPSPPPPGVCPACEVDPSTP